MTSVRYALLALLTLAPALAFGQVVDSLHVEISDVEYPSYKAVFGPFVGCSHPNIGPLPVIPVRGDGTTAPAEEGCDPLLNSAEVEGNIAFVERGTCAFVQKVLNAQTAGAAAVLIYNDDRVPDDDETLVIMGGDCPDCVIPAAFVARARS